MRRKRNEPRVKKVRTAFKDWYEIHQNDEQLNVDYRKYADGMRKKGECPEPRMLWARENFQDE